MFANLICMHVCVCVCVCVCLCVCVWCVCVCVCVGYWPREKLLQHAQLLVQQGCGVRQEGPECGLVHPSLVHLFVGLVLIATFGLFGLFFFFFFFDVWFYSHLPSALFHLHRYLRSFASSFFLFVLFFLSLSLCVVLFALA